MTTATSHAHAATALMASAIVLCVVTGPAAQQSGGASTGTGTVVGTGSFTMFVENMDRTLAFYQQAFGMAMPPLPASGARPYNPTNPQLFAMFDIAGARERHESARAAGVRTNVEVMEVQDVPHRTVTLRPQDPGNVSLVLIVRDLDAALPGATQAMATVATPGGKPVSLAGGIRAVLIRDLDNRYIELRQPVVPPPEATGTGNIGDLRVLIAVADMAKTVRPIATSSASRWRKRRRSRPTPACAR